MTVFSFSKMVESIGSLVSYIPITLLTVIISVIFGMALGFFLAWAKLSKYRVLRAISNFYTEVVRGTPFLVLLLVVFYGLPLLTATMGYDMSATDKMVFMLITLTLFAASRLSEMMRSAYESVEKTQMEAAVSAGLTGAQALYHVILPQAVYIALPNFGNIVVGVVLETSLGFTIGMIDLLGQARMINSWGYGAYSLEIYLAVGLIYWALSLLISQGTTALERFIGKRMGISFGRKKRERRADA